MTDIQNTDENLIPVSVMEIGGVSTLAANARDLHQFLGVKRDFSTWIKKRIAAYEFIEDEDFIAIPRFGDGYKSDRNGRLIDESGQVIPIDYILKLGMAKELGMVEKNERGRLIRKYFIHCEQKLLEIPEITGQAPKRITAATPIPPHFELREQNEFTRAFGRRVWFWTLEKRDRIMHPGIDRYALHSITMDIRDALKNELYQQCVKHFSSTTPAQDPELIRFVNAWEPSFITEMANVA